MQGLGTILIDTLRSVQTTDRPYALVDYPNYLNPGDAAIWLGARKALAILNGGPPAYTAPLREFSSRACLAAIGTGTIYFLGGGNFGDLYPKHHRARLKVIRSVPESPIVLLPSSCAWADAPSPEIIGETQHAFRARTSRARFFAREPKTQSQLFELLEIESVLCPDLVHALDISGPPPSKEVAAILRRDREAAGPPASGADWSDMRGQRFWNRSGKLMLRFTGGVPRMRLQDWIASKKTQAAIDALAHGRVLVTDRLHAMLLGTALGRDVVALDNGTGKVMAYHDQWGVHLTRVHRAATIESAWRTARELAASHTEGT